MQEFSQKELRVQIGSVVLGGILLLLAGWIFLIAPVFEDIKETENKLVMENQRQELLRNIEVLKRKFEEKEKVILDAETRNSLASKITNIAKSQNIEVLSLEPKYTEAPLYHRAQINLTLSGTFVPFVRFLKELETMRPPLQVLSLTVGDVSRRSRQTTSSGLTLHLQIETLFRKTNEPQ